MQNDLIVVYNQLKEKNIHSKSWKNDKLRTVAWLVNKMGGNQFDFYLIAKDGFKRDKIKAKVFFNKICREKNLDLTKKVRHYFINQNFKSGSVPKDFPMSQNLNLKKWDTETKSTIRTANDRLKDAKDLPPVKQLIGQFWAEGELHILFADTGVGKSLLAVDIADHLSRGENLMDLKNEGGKKKVLYYDFELTDRQFRSRYSNDNNEHYNFDSNLFTDRIDLAKVMIKDIVKYTLNKIKIDVNSTGSDVVIIDNITYLTLQSTADQEVAIRLMKDLDSLKKDQNISIMVLAHTPKIDRFMPITVNNLGGSKQIPNFSDSVSAIGKSIMGKNDRYWKQIKCRQFQEVYTENNTLHIEIVKSDKKIEFIKKRTCPEREHLPKSKKEAKKVDKEEIIKLSSQGVSVRKISSQTGVSKSSVDRWIRESKQKRVSQK